MSCVRVLHHWVCLTYFPGNVYDPAVLDAVAAAVPADGVLLCCADGGFSAARDHTDQADVMYRLVVCQVAVTPPCKLVS